MHLGRGIGAIPCCSGLRGLVGKGHGCLQAIHEEGERSGQVLLKSRPTILGSQCLRTFIAGTEVARAAKRAISVTEVQKKPILKAGPRTRQIHLVALRLVTGGVELVMCIPVEDTIDLIEGRAQARLSSLLTLAFSTNFFGSNPLAPSTLTPLSR